MHLEFPAFARLEDENFAALQVVKDRDVKTTQEANVKRIIDKNFWVQKKTQKTKTFRIFLKNGNITTSRK